MNRGLKAAAAALAGGLPIFPGTVAPAGSVPTAEVIRQETALIERVRAVCRSEVFYLLADRADPERPGPLNTQMLRILDDPTLDPLRQALRLLRSLTDAIDGAEGTVDCSTSRPAPDDAERITGQVIAARYRQLDERILRHLAETLAPEVLEAFRERFATLARADVSRWELEDFTDESYSALGELIDAYPHDGHVRRLYSVLLDVHARLQRVFGEQVLEEMNAIEYTWAGSFMTPEAKREAYRPILERIHQEIARYRSVRQIAFALETEIDLKAPQRYYLRALGGAFEFNKNAGDLRDDEVVTALARVVMRHTAEWHTVSKLRLLATVLAEGPEGMHRWMYGTVDCHDDDDAEPHRMTASKNDRYATSDCACAMYYSGSPKRFAECCEGYKRTRFEENWYRLIAIFQDVAVRRGAGWYIVGSVRHDSTAGVLAEAISSRIVTDHTDLIDEVHGIIRCLFDPREGSCPEVTRRTKWYEKQFRVKLREPSESGVLAESIGATIHALAHDPGMPDGTKMEKIAQLGDVLILLHTDEALEILLDVFDHGNRVFPTWDRGHVAASLESMWIGKLVGFVQVDRVLDKPRRRLAADLLDHLLLKCQEVSLDPFGSLYDYRYIRALGRIKAIQPPLPPEEQAIGKDDLINDIVRYHGTNPEMFVSIVFHLSDILMDYADRRVFWDSEQTDARTAQAREVFAVLSWVNASLGRAKSQRAVAGGVLSSYDLAEIRILERAFHYFDTQTRFGRTSLVRRAPPRFFEAVLILMQHWVHMLPRHLIDRMRDEVASPLKRIVRVENAEAFLVGGGHEFLTPGIKQELEILEGRLGSRSPG